MSEERLLPAPVRLARMLSTFAPQAIVDALTSPTCSNLEEVEDVAAYAAAIRKMNTKYLAELIAGDIDAGKISETDLLVVMEAITAAAGRIASEVLGIVEYPEHFISVVCCAHAWYVTNTKRWVIAAIDQRVVAVPTDGWRA